MWPISAGIQLPSRARLTRADRVVAPAPRTGVLEEVAVPVAVGPLAIGPLVVGPLAVGPLVVGPLVVGPLVVGPLVVGPRRTSDPPLPSR